MGGHFSQLRSQFIQLVVTVVNLINPGILAGNWVKDEVISREIALVVEI